MKRDTAGCTLARMINQKMYTQPILAYRDQLGRELYMQEAKKETFVEHIRVVYSSPQGATGPSVMAYLDALQLLQLEDEEWLDLESLLI
ncbi:hypothetical protein NDU88_003891 [Pleurodeles waltl]|uniref:Uncharacterized protein n=1 Tax=Pleurodeles waltl TaxID=8319 RepID=A0AAV7SH72_PLEWA|nr:hypothetical protein NDU88_003891 [Pleurodeles waltl]